MLEGVLDYLEVWTPREGYARISAFPTDSILPNLKNIIIHKIHGSENFVESSVIGKNKNQTGIGFNINSSIYPKSGANSHLGGGALNPRGIADKRVSKELRQRTAPANHPFRSL